MTSKKSRLPFILDFMGKKLALFVGFFIGLPLVAFISLMLYLQTTSGHQWLEATLKDNLDSENSIHVKIKDIHGALPLTIKASTVEIFDEKDLISRITNPKVSWSPWRLLTGTIKVSKIAADRVELHRLPKEKASQDDDEPFALPVAIVLSKISTPILWVHERVGGSVITTAFEGSASLATSGYAASIKTTNTKVHGIAQALAMTAHVKGDMQQAGYISELLFDGHKIKTKGNIELAKNIVLGVIEGHSGGLDKLATNLKGDIAAHATYTYNIKDAQLQASIKATSAGLHTPYTFLAPLKNPFSFNTKLSFANNVLQFTEIDLTAPKLTLTGEAAYQKNKVKFSDVQLNLVDAQQVNKSLSGALSTILNGYYDIARQEGLFKIESPDVVVEKIPLKKTVATIDYNRKEQANRIQINSSFDLNNIKYTFLSYVRATPNTVQIEKSELAAWFGHIKGAGNVMTASGLATGSIETNFTDISPLTALLGHPLSGGLTAKIDLTAPKGTQKANFTAKLEGVDGAEEAIQVLNLEGEFFNILKNPTGNVTCTGKGFQYKGVQSDTFYLSYKGTMKEASFNALFEGGNFNLQASLDGNSNGSSTRYALHQLDSTYKELHINLYADAKDKTLVHIAPNNTIIHPATLMVGDGCIKLKGEFGPRKTNAEVTATCFPLEVLSKLGVYNGLSGKAGCHVAVSGTPTAPIIQSTLSAEYFYNTLEDLGTDQLFVLDGVFGYRQNVFDIDFHGKSSKAGALHLIGKIPMSISLSPFNMSLYQNKNIDLKLDSNLRLVALAPFLSIAEMVVDGDLVGKIQLKGPPKYMRFFGDLSLTDGYVEHATFQTVIKNITGKLIGKGRELVFDQVRGEDGDAGTFKITGGVKGLQTGSRVDLNALFKNFTYARSEALKGMVDGKVSLKGPVEKLILSADVTTPKTEVDIFEHIGGSIPELSVWDVSKGDPKSYVSQSPKKTSFATLKIAAVSPGHLFIRGRGLESEWKANVTVEGPAKLPVLKGKVELVRGSFSFNEKTLNLTKGEVAFIGSQDNIPLLNIHASYSAQDIALKIIITGKANSPKISLTSTPPLPEDEVLSYFLFGKSISDITPVQSLMLARSLYSLKNKGVLTDFVDKVRGVFGLDVITFKESSTPSDDDFSVTLSVGKYITDKLYVSVDQGIGPGDTKVLANYELTKSLSLESEIGATAGAGVGLNYKFDY